ncbi:MAG: DUF934 domain-containing protein [Pseudomonadales bacterium]|nr:DUF934 domain-containing protein [Pseudomonadales bacterium]
MNECLCGQLAEYTDKHLIVPLDCWLQCQDELLARKGKTGVWLDSHQLPEELGKKGINLPLIALNFPTFKDGRAFSSARELRQNLGFKGELRAIGDVLRDQLFYMARCGFDAFALREDQDIAEALTGFADFREVYQASPDQPLPLFRRRS